MQLVTKLPKDKLPFIGIVFEKMWDAEKTNQDFINEHKELQYKLKLIPNGSLIDIEISQDEINERHTYKNLKYDADKLKLFLHTTQKATQFNFSHLVNVEDKHIVVKTRFKYYLFVLKISEIKLVLEDGL